MESLFFSSGTIRLVEAKSWPNVIILSFLHKSDFAGEFYNTLTFFKHIQKNIAFPSWAHHWKADFPTLTWEMWHSGILINLWVLMNNDLDLEGKQY